MDIQLQGWECRGLRCPNMSIKFNRDDGAGDLVPRVSLVQMPNGTGKTTTLRLIRACLTGEAKYWDADQIRQYRTLAGIADKGVFTLFLVVGDAALTIDMSFDFIQGEVEYRTSSPEFGGVKNGWKPPQAVRRYFNSEFIRLVVFDGEFAEQLLDEKETKAEAAIDALCQLDVFDHISERAQILWKKQKSEGALNAKEIKQLETAIAEREADLKKSERRVQIARTNVLKKQEEGADLEKDVNKEIEKNEGLKKALEEAKMEERRVGDNYNRKLGALMERCRDPHRISIRINDKLKKFKNELDKSKLPESSSKQFFIDLVEEDACICGRPFDDNTRAEVIRQSDRYLGSEVTSVLNEMKESITRLAGGEEEVDKEFNLEIGAVKNMRRELDVALQNTERAKRNAQKAAGADVQRKSERIAVLKSDIDRLSTSIDKIEEEIKHDKKRLSQLRDEYAAAKGTRSVKEKADILTRICRESKLLARGKVKEALVLECNEKLGHVLADNPLRILKIDNAVQLENQSGASVGQTLAVGYTFITSLFDRATYAFPFIVDSPANPIDNKVRREIAELIPNLTKQFVAFTISSEREGFVKPLESAADYSISFHTVYRSGSESNDAVIKYGREEFFKFHKDEE